jgi:hypothetical protein
VSRNRTAIAIGSARLMAVCSIAVMLTMPRDVSGQTQQVPETDADAQPAKAQQPRVPVGLGIGMAAERRIASDANASDVWGIALFPRFIARGFGPAFDLSWTSTGIVNALGSGSAEVGVIRMKAAMGGVAWQKMVGKRISPQIEFIAGYSFNSAEPSGNHSLRAQVAVPQPVIDVGDSFAWQTRAAIWRELGPRIGFVAAARYLHTRPRFTFADGTERVWTGDRITLQAGLAFTLIKAPWAR